MPPAWPAPRAPRGAGGAAPAGGPPPRREPPAGPAELRTLANAFNAMAAELESARAHIEDERRRLATTIESLGDALVVTDSAGTITAVNPRATDLVPELVPGARVDGRGLPSLDDALLNEVTLESGGRTLAVTA